MITGRGFIKQLFVLSSRKALSDLDTVSLWHYSVWRCDVCMQRPGKSKNLTRSQILRERWMGLKNGKRTLRVGVTKKAERSGKGAALPLCDCVIPFTQLTFLQFTQFFKVLFFWSEKMSKSRPTFSSHRFHLADAKRSILKTMSKVSSEDKIYWEKRKNKSRRNSSPFSSNTHLLNTYSAEPFLGVRNTRPCLTRLNYFSGNSYSWQHRFLAQTRVTSLPCILKDSKA